MGIFNQGITLEWLNSLAKDTLVETIGIEFTFIGDDYLEARMPVDHRTRQPFKMLHGGASVTLAETLGSVAATCCLHTESQFCVGLEVNANHIRSVREGFVKGIAKPLHIGKKTHVWEIRITDENSALICISRITIAILDKKQDHAKNVD